MGNQTKPERYGIKLIKFNLCQLSFRLSETSSDFQSIHCRKLIDRIQESMIESKRNGN